MCVNSDFDYTYYVYKINTTQPTVTLGSQRFQLPDLDCSGTQGHLEVLLLGSLCQNSFILHFMTY